MVNPGTTDPATEFHAEQARLRNWYLARMRKRALCDAESVISCTPATLISADREKIKSLIESQHGLTKSRAVLSASEQTSSRPLRLAGSSALLVMQLLLCAVLWPGNPALSVCFFIVGSLAGLLGYVGFSEYESRQEDLLAFLRGRLSASGAAGANRPDAPSVECLVVELCNQLSTLAEGQNLIADYSPDVICVLDENLEFVSVSASSKYCWDKLHFELIGWQLSQILVDPADQGAVRRNFEDCKKETGEHLFDVTVAGVGGRPIDTLWAVEWSWSEKLYFACVKDVTTEKELQRIRSEFVALLTHDLRSPIINVQLALRLIEKGLYGDLNQQGKSRLSECNESIDFLLDLIADVLDVHRLESVGIALTYSSVDFASLVDESISSVQVMAELKNVSVTRRVPEGECELDKVRMKRVLINLLANAIKFSPKNSSVEVEVVAKESDVSFAVKDQGPGISSDSIEHVFDRFTNVGNSSARRDSSGIGLFASKATVESHGGRISVQSSEGGSTFLVQIPRIQTAQPPRE